MNTQPVRRAEIIHPAARRVGARTCSLLAMVVVQGSAWAQTPLADQPVFANTSVPGNLALALSVEFPTAVSVAHPNNTFDTTQSYVGYFDPKKCYGYSHNANEALRHFFPSGAAINRQCTGAQAGKWSGSFLNWATMQTVDPFRWVLTGGYRVTDTATETILEKAWASGQGGASNFPNRSLGNNTLVAAHTPLASWTSFNMRIWGLGNRMRFTVTGDLNGTSTPYDPGAAVNSALVYDVFVRVKVCDSNVAVAGPLETNCTQYPNGNHKPTGLIQQYADRIRYSAFGYLNDSNLQRDGGVLRARQKFVGPNIITPGQAPSANARREWDPSTGVFVRNPDATDATDTATLFGTPVDDSGVINYLNKFGQITPGNYKTFDPVGELYYAALRYFRNLGNVPEWTAKSADTNTNKAWVDGFPVITTWDDPIQYSCQKNFILGIGDVNSHADKNVPGNTGTAQEPTKPALVSADTSVNAVTATNKVGALHGLGSSLGTTYPYNGCCNSNSALMAGLAYDANTTDIRPDVEGVGKTQGRQSVQTYWLDVLEYQNYKANNQFYLAAKYGGFEPPSGFDPYTRTTDIPLAWWHTTGETVGSQQRPDNYFTAARPDQIVSGLTRAFGSIAERLSAFTTSFATSLPQVATSGVGSYASKFDASTWTGEVKARTTVFDLSTGLPSLTDAWDFSAKLGAQVANGGWDNNRVMLSWSGTAGIAFRHGSLTSEQRGDLDTSWRSGDDSADFLNYLRGDPKHEVGSTAEGSSFAYRRRTSLLGDIVNARARPVGPPQMPYASATNPGYGAFKATWSTRPTMVYAGSNAGVLHAINGSITGSDAGREVFAYVPGVAFKGGGGSAATSGLQHRGNPEFAHRNLVDGPIVVADIDLGRTASNANVPPGSSWTPNWRTVLIGAMGKGGRAYYAIDVTDPAAFANGVGAAAREENAKDRVLWEFTHSKLGYTYGEPAVVKTRKWGWVLVFASGHNNADGKGYFFIVNPRNGQLLEGPLLADDGGVATAANPAGISQVQAYVPDRTDFTAESVYAGDLMGNLWRLDLTPASAAYAAPVRIAQLTDSAGNAVPITSRPLVVIQPGTNRRFVTLGSGKLLASSDLGDTQSQGFYAIIDGTGSRFNTAAHLPSGISFPLRNTGTGPSLRKLTDLTQPVTLNLATEMGWWVDLGSQSDGGSGWRVISDPTAFLSTVAFTAMVPSGEACNPSGTNRVFAIDLGTGQSRLTNNAATVPFLQNLPGVVTDLRFFSVGGKPRLLGGTDTGEVGQFQGNWNASAGPRRLNWRELQLAE
jgi:type IV pilus assembly protein PilY1